MRNSSPIAQGEVIADKYQVEGVIGEGGMGLVVSAWHLGLRQRVAIKLLLTDGGMLEAAAIERFQREARAAARIRSEHVCRVLDVGMLPNGTPYLVMEFLEGCDLADELARRGCLPAVEAVGYVLEACEALAEAHVAGIIHRDLKPANLFLARRASGTRCLKLLDFGVSKSLGESSLSHYALTKTAAVVGSPLYMSPEQLNSAKDVDARTDIWSLGALTYELVAGRPPFHGETIGQLVNAVLNGEPPTFKELGITAPGGLEAALRKALAKKREERFASVGEFATALGPFAPDDSISVSRILRIRSDTLDPLPETVDDRDVRRTPRSGRIATPASATPNLSARSSGRKRWAWIALLLGLIVLAGLGAFLSKRLGSETATQNPTGPLLPVVSTRDASVSQPASAVPPTPSASDSPAQKTQVLPEPPVSPAPTLDGASERAQSTPRPPSRTPTRLPKQTPARGSDPGSENANFGGRR